MNTTLRLITISVISMIVLDYSAVAQIFGPEGMNMPGAYDGFTNPPSVNALAGIQKTGGTFLLDAGLATRRYTTLIHVDEGGADITPGTYDWLFTSGPSTNYFQNKWGGVNVIMDSLQNYTKEGVNDTVTVTAGKFYTVNFKDNGYSNTTSIWIEMA